MILKCFGVFSTDDFTCCLEYFLLMNVDFLVYSIGLDSIVVYDSFSVCIHVNMFILLFLFSNLILEEFYIQFTLFSRFAMCVSIVCLKSVSIKRLQFLTQVKSPLVALTSKLWQNDVFTVIMLDSQYCVFCMDVLSRVKLFIPLYTVLNFNHIESTRQFHARRWFILYGTLKLWCCWV